jgi:peptide/nickel transport system substrate-binding protein
MRISGEQVPFALDSWAAGTGEALSTLEALLHSREGSFGTFNTAGYGNPKLDVVIERAGTTLEPFDRLTLIAEAMKIVQEDLPVIPLVSRHDLYAVRPGIVWEPGQERLRARDFRPE